MELRFADDEKKEDSQNSLKLSEANHQQMEKEDNGVPNPWDFNVESEPVVISSISSTAETDTTGTKNQETKEVMLKIGMVAVYVCFILEIVSIAWICTQENSDVYVNLLKFQGLFYLCTFVCLGDAILVNVWYGKKFHSFFAMVFLFSISGAEK